MICFKYDHGVIPQKGPDRVQTDRAQTARARTDRAQTNKATRGKTTNRQGHFVQTQIKHKQYISKQVRTWKTYLSSGESVRIVLPKDIFQ